MCDIVLHPGLFKTGTTFLQKGFFPFLDNVNLIVSQYFKNWDVQEGKINIISEENLSLSRPLFYDHRKAILVLDYLHKLFPNAKIIIGTREKISWLRSCYNQFIRDTGEYVSFETYYDEYKDFMDVDVYLKEIKNRWENVFVYHQETLRDELKPMCDFIGCSFPVFYLDKRFNVSLSDNQLRVLRFFNFFHLNYEVNNFIKKINK